MYCPVLCINPDNRKVSFGQCMQDACAWWITTGTGGKCAMCQMGLYAVSH
jgi:hypothetical protein